MQGGGYGFLFRSEFFFPTAQELEYLFFCRAKREIFFPEFSIRLYYKNSESEYFFQRHWESEYFFRRKTLTPPPLLQVKWSVP